ncbi:uncharacterized protein LOC110459496 [Mizuhopecten yessoensis]|uniref:uncharacterized protein LOC110459496 n=1 Tax=Mizuhopecten yessoensis TaxID=6573 RepID=UPI000B45BDE5|nr:uncharacterized protein LOC110459496 [Mizuhopecten yessoensis]
MDVYSFKDELELSAWVSVAVGNSIIFVLSILQKVSAAANKIENRLVYFVVSRSYLYLLGFGCVNQWRGIWYLLDIYTGITWQGATGTLLSGACALCCFRCFRSSLASPLVLQLDNDRASMFTLTGRLSSKIAPNPMFALDICLTVFIINNFVVFYWRGMWTLFDLFLVPENTLRSAAYCFTISFTLAIPVLIGQHAVQLVSQKLHENMCLLQIVFEDFFMALAGIVCICHWRGTWLSLDAIFFPNNEELSVWGSHVIGYVGLILLCSFKSSLSCGCAIDKTIHEVEHSIFDLKFFSKFRIQQAATHSFTPATEM